MHKAHLGVHDGLPLSGIALTEEKHRPVAADVCGAEHICQTPEQQGEKHRYFQLQAMPSSCTTSEEPTDMHRYTMRGCTSAIEK